MMILIRRSSEDQIFLIAGDITLNLKSLGEKGIVLIKHMFLQKKILFIILYFVRIYLMWIANKFLNDHFIQCFTSH